ncbi:hypothetical protein N481_24340 [Pseudoalteromonas luteoviolacea S4047-1]|uniref:Uncharacterized protein n=1 Tax=Pseudoalteromonas luteoviolacea S4054 TaxID=1129367 RepID=A0A0F6A4P3_9GAMM|nr:hypothetical protein N479_23245 [Pseudoalteromonas luteoviolacea S4054]KZN66328.1 hypothetical protein N481_24340 [Pseudoalteromonas luteoviolacea S4047-1]
MFFFERDKQGEVVALKTQPNERARNKESYQGTFFKQSSCII